MQPKHAAIAGGVLGLVTGLVFLSDIPGAPFFCAAVLAFMGFECTWALNHISGTKKISKAAEKRIKDKEKK